MFLGDRNEGLFQLEIGSQHRKAPYWEGAESFPPIPTHSHQFPPLFFFKFPTF